MANITQKVKESLLLIREANKVLGAEQTGQKALLFPPIAHDHDDQYYTKVQTDGLLPVIGTDIPSLVGGKVPVSFIPTIDAGNINVIDTENHFTGSSLEEVLDEIEDSIDLLNGVNFFDKVKGHAEEQIALTGDPSPLDGVTFVTGDRILVLGQTDSTENGIYDIDTVGAWTRSADADDSSDFRVNKTIYISEGDDGSGQTLAVGDVGEGFTLGTDSLVFLHKSDSGTIANGSIGANHIADEAVTYMKLSPSLKGKADKVDLITVTQAIDVDALTVQVDAINTYPAADASKLSLIEDGAEVNSVETVNGHAPDGAKNVTIGKSDIGLSEVENYSTATMPIPTSVANALATKEDAFTKQSAFNKPFGSSENTVTMGNDTRLSDQREPVNFGTAGSAQGIKQLVWDNKGRVQSVIEKSMPVIVSPNNLTVSFGDLVNFNASVQFSGVEIDGDWFGKNDYVQIDRETGHIVNLGEEVPVGTHTIDIVFRPADIDEYKVTKQTFTLIVNGILAAVDIQISNMDGVDIIFNSNLDENHYSLIGNGRIDSGYDGGVGYYADVLAVGSDLDYNIYERDMGDGSYQYVAMSDTGWWTAFNSTERWTVLSNGLRYVLNQVVYKETITTQSTLENGKFIPWSASSYIDHVTV